LQLNLEGEKEFFSEKEPQKIKEKYCHNLVYLIFSLLGYKDCINQKKEKNESI
jgi:hypothetical protein